MNLSVGKYLIARPTIEYGFFRQSVVFVYEHTAFATAGVNLTKPTSIQFSSISNQFGYVAQTQDPIVYKGGPVNEQSLVMLHSSEFVSSNTLITNSGLNISSDAFMVEKLSYSAWPRHYRLFTGTSMWHAGQLKKEIQTNHWLVSDLPSDLVFEYDGDELWTKAVDYVGKAVFDPYI